MLARLYDSLFQSIDKDLDGTLTFQEFIEASSKRSEMHRRQASGGPVRMVFAGFRLLLAIALLIFFSQTVEAARRMRWSNGRDFTASSSLAQLCRNSQTYPRYDSTFIKRTKYFLIPNSCLHCSQRLSFFVFIVIILRDFLCNAHSIFGNRVSSLKF